MLTHIPTRSELPSFGAMLADIGSPSPRELARRLDVHPATVARYLAAGDAPLPVLLCLFWVTRWGRSRVDCHAVNDARVQAEEARFLRADVRRLERELARVLAAGDFGSANAPTFTPPRLHLGGVRPLGLDPVAQAR